MSKILTFLVFKFLISFKEVYRLCVCVYGVIFRDDYKDIKSFYSLIINNYIVKMSGKLNRVTSFGSQIFIVVVPNNIGVKKSFLSKES